MEWVDRGLAGERFSSSVCWFSRVLGKVLWVGRVCRKITAVVLAGERDKVS